MNDGASLDPLDWSALREQGHRMLDDMFDHLQGLRDQPVWRQPPDALRQGFREPLPAEPTPVEDLHARFLAEVLPYAGGNLHPGFLGWVQGGGTAVGMLAEMLSGGLNANLGGRDHMPIEVERQIVGWCRELFRFPEDAGGLLVSGASQANFIGVLVARQRALGPQVRRKGIGGDVRLTAYASQAAHGCIPRAMEMAGLGREALRLIPVNARHEIDLAELRAAIARDRQDGCTPFLIVGAAGTVDTGAIDDLEALTDLARAEGLHLHVDGAFGALGMLSEAIAPRLAGIERADSLAFDFHKWAQVPYDAGFILVRDPQLHRDTFAAEASYLARDNRGLAGGEWWPCDYGPELSRGFRALKTWFTLKAYGTRALGAMIDHCCLLTQALALRVEQEAELELLAPVALNVVCFRYRCDDAEAVNRSLVADLHEQGLVAPSLTRIRGRTAIRAAIVNHRTTTADIETLVRSVVQLGRTAAPQRRSDHA